MRRICLYFLVLTVIDLIPLQSSRAQDKPPEKPQYMGRALVQPTSGFRAEFLEEIAYYEQRFTRLAEAMPAEKYTWRPGDGVRSVGEVFAHVAVANYLVGRTLTPIPPGATYGFDNQTIAKTTMALSGDKTKLLQDMKTSFSSLKFAVLQLNDADADKPQDIFNRHTTLRGAFTMITGHFLASTSANLSPTRA